MKKKIVIIVIIVVVVFVLLAALGGDDSSDSESGTAYTTEETNAEEPETSETEETVNITEDPSTISTSAEARKYMDSCSWEFNSNDFLRYEEDYIGKDFAFVAKVSQILNDGSIIVHDDENGDGHYSDNQIAILDDRSFDNTKILEDDILTIYGRYVGRATFTIAITDTTTTVPEFQMFLCEIEGVSTKPTEDISNNMDYSPYEDILTDIGLGYESDCLYTVYDIDNDGIKELIVSYGENNMDWLNAVYTMDIYGEIEYVGDFSGYVSLYGDDAGNGIYAVDANGGSQTVSLITKDDGQLKEQIMLSEDTEEYFENDYPIEWSDISDFSLLQ